MQVVFQGDRGDLGERATCNVLVLFVNISKIEPYEFGALLLSREKAAGAVDNSGRPILAAPFGFE